MHGYYEFDVPRMSLGRKLVNFLQNIVIVWSNCPIGVINGLQLTKDIKKRLTCDSFEVIDCDCARSFGTSANLGNENAKHWSGSFKRRYLSKYDDNTFHISILHRIQYWKSIRLLKQYAFESLDCQINKCTHREGIQKVWVGASKVISSDQCWEYYQKESWNYPGEVDGHLGW